MISLRQVIKSYNPNETVLKNINLELNRGEFLFVVGDSGAGKSTLLKLMTGEELPSQGKIYLGVEKNITSIAQLLRLRRRMGVVHQDYRLLKEQTVFENVAMPLFFGRAGTGITSVPAWGGGVKKLVDDALRAVDLPLKILDTKVKHLSGGEQQRVAVARAIINFPDILIADEPTGSLDHDHTWAIMDLFQKLNLRGMTIIVATHDREIVRRVRKRTCHLSGGSLRLDER